MLFLSLKTSLICLSKGFVTLTKTHSERFFQFLIFFLRLAGFFSGMLSEFADFVKNKSRKDWPAKLEASLREMLQEEALSSCAGRASVVFVKKIEQM